MHNTEEYTPSAKAGVLVYFSCADIGASLRKVSEAGGSVLVDKKLISEDVGYMGVALDSEGNRIAFFARS